MDATENYRRARVNELNSNAGEREILEEKYGQVWDTDQLTDDFDIQGFMAPFIVVTRKGDRQKGSLEFQHSPRFYFNFRKV